MLKIVSAGIVLFLALLSLGAQPATPQEDEVVSVFLINRDEWQQQGEKAIPAFDSGYTKAMRALLHACGDGVPLSKKKEGSAYVIVYRKRGFVGVGKPGLGRRGRSRWEASLLESTGERISLFGGRSAKKTFGKLCQQTDNLKQVKDERTD